MSQFSQSSTEHLGTLLGEYRLKSSMMAIAAFGLVWIWMLPFFGILLAFMGAWTEGLWTTVFGLILAGGLTWVTLRHVGNKGPVLQIFEHGLHEEKPAKLTTIPWDEIRAVEYAPLQYARTSMIKALAGDQDPFYRSGVMGTRSDFIITGTSRNVIVVESSNGYKKPAEIIRIVQREFLAHQLHHYEDRFASGEVLDFGVLGLHNERGLIDHQSGDLSFDNLEHVQIRRGKLAVFEHTAQRSLLTRRPWANYYLAEIRNFPVFLAVLAQKHIALDIKTSAQLPIVIDPSSDHTRPSPQGKDGSLFGG